jgi:hypothetical protein
MGNRPEGLMKEQDEALRDNHYVIIT